MTEADTGPAPGPDPQDPTAAPAALDNDAESEVEVEVEPDPEADAEPEAPPDDIGWDLPESDRAYVMASLTRLSGDHAEISTRLRAVEDRVEDLSVGVDSVEDAAAAISDRTDAVSDAEVGSAGDAHGGDDEESPGDEADEGGVDEGVDMVELVAWVRDHVALLLERKLPQTGTPPHWCRRWWLHAEAIARFEALRRGWVEAVSGEGNAMVVWFEHLDLMLAVLMGEGGTFSGCTPGEHRVGSVRALGHDDPDATFFADFDLPG